MSRFIWVPFLACLLLAACKIEQTPEEYYDGRFAAAPDLEAMRGDIEGMLRPLLEARTPGAVRTAIGRLPTVPDGQVASPDPPGAADEAPFPGPPESSVRIGEAGNVGWFLVRYGERDVVSGVTERRDGVWRVVQIHHAPGVTPDRAEAEAARDG